MILLEHKGVVFENDIVPKKGDHDGEDEFDGVGYRRRLCSVVEQADTKYNYGKEDAQEGCSNEVDCL